MQGWGMSKAFGDDGSIARAEVVQQLRDLGVEPGGVLLVHTAFSRVRPVEGGPLGLIAALREALGPYGTLAMPSISGDDDRPFDPRATPCLGLGIVADSFWRLPGVLRSDSPHAFAAAGPQAVYITAPHSVDVPHGLDRPPAESTRWTSRSCCSASATTTIRRSTWPRRSPTCRTAGRSTSRCWSKADRCGLSSARSTIAARTLPWSMAGSRRAGYSISGRWAMPSHAWRERAISWRWSPTTSPRIRSYSSILRALTWSVMRHERA
jgi:hypothetical protein